jgi:two-component system chemotaxis response regulator CheB
VQPYEPAGELPIGLVVIGASAGGVEALRRLVSDLPPDLPAAVCIVLHIAPGSPSALAAILDRASRLSCRPAVDNEPLRAGEVLVAPPDHHLTISDGRVEVSIGPRENGHRPSVDVLFRTAAEALNGRVIGVILSGTRDDGTAGLALIKAHGGSAVVQDPREALYPGMPASAIAHVHVDEVVPIEQIAEVVVRLVREQAARNPGPTGAEDPVPDDPGELAGNPIISICPECGGVLSEHREAGMTQWRCRVGHRYSPESLADAQAEDVEAGLWAAVRALEDRQALLERMAVQLEARHQPRSARSFSRRAREAAAQAQAVRRALSEAAGGTLMGVADEDDLAAEGVKHGGS